MHATVHATGLTDALGLGFSLRDWLEDNAAELTTEHAASSYGQPVLVKDGRGYGPADLPGVVLHLSATNAGTAPLIAPAKAAGWAVKVQAWCNWCGNELPSPETQQPGAIHPACAATREVVTQDR